MVEGGLLIDPEPLPTALTNAAVRVARDFGLPRDWLNTGPSDLLRLGLPGGFVTRIETRDYGSGLTVHFASQRDQIHLKLYAMVDQGAGRHQADLLALSPTREELSTRGDGHEPTTRPRASGPS